MYARIAARYIHTYCREVYADFKHGPMSMPSTHANGEMIDVFDHAGYGTHKYIPADRLTTDLGEPIGAGVYAYWKMKDGSYLLLTCKGPLAYWKGDDSPAKWGE